MNLAKPIAACFIGALGMLAGCASYHTPSRGADLSALTPEQRAAQTELGVRSAFDTKPLAVFPAAIAIVRVESGDYRSETAQGIGSGQFSIVTTRDVEDPKTIDRLASLPGIAGVAPVNRLLLPQEVHNDLDLRQIAAQVHADILLIYTLDTTFTSNDVAIPLSVITLGLSPNVTTHVVTTASAIMMDTRSGFIYGVDEATQTTDGIADAWTTDTAIDLGRRKNETMAFDKLERNMEKTWAGIVHDYTGPATRPAS